ncbi:exonuclease 1 [Skeletonema marinoi]|uniref:Exonuclease 1 n=1 Tax=Skeletonema marinoi TaxID=267567 RepID=A0AAD8XVU4_9STRA|nr:exonuclease 1 [Skeletonema marinoi]
MPGTCLLRSLGLGRRRCCQLNTLPSNTTMGINGLLPRILPSAGRENYDLRALKDGIISLTHHEHQQQPPSKRRRRTQHDTTTTSSKGWTRRKVRIAVDVNGWISRAAHGYGGTLMDERHLSYHGRAQLLLQQQEQQQLLLEGSGEEKTNDGETNDDVAINNNNIIQQQQQQEQQQRLEYIQKIVSFTLKRIESMREECSALVLPVLDGNTPPCKLEVVRERSARRKRAVEERDQLLMNNNNEEGQDNNAESAENEAARTEADVLSKISNSKRGGMGKDYSMRRELLAELLNEFRKRKWPFLVAPYEADGQLAYLANSGAVDVVVTEDSDLIGLGVPTLIYKLGGWNGSNTANRGGSSSSSSSSSHLGTMLHRRDLGSAHDINLLDFSDAMLATMFVAAGCDYCPNLKGIGVVKARNIVKKAFHGGEADSEVALTSLVPRSDEPVLKSVLHAYSVSAVRMLAKSCYLLMILVRQKHAWHMNESSSLLWLCIDTHCI